MVANLSLKLLRISVFLFFALSITAFCHAQHIIINDNARYTNQQLVTLQLNYDVPKEMRIGNSEYLLESAEWLPFQSEIPWELSENDETKTVYVQFRNVKDKISPVFSSKIILDTTPPERCALYYERGVHANTTALNFKLYGQGASEVMLSNTEDFSESFWVPFNELYYNWRVPEGDGEKTVYAKFKDQAGNISPIKSCQVIVDRLPPKALNVEVESPYLIVDSARHMGHLAHTAVVNLKLKAEGAEFMKLNHTPSFTNERWRLYQEEFKEWVIPEFPQQEVYYKVYALFRDKAGNESEPIHTTIYVDNLPPASNTVYINQDKPATNTPEVTLYLNSNGAHEMQISHDSLFTNKPWISFQDKITWTLDTLNLNTDKVVYARFRDKAHNISKIVHDYITYDNIPPQNCKVVLLNEYKRSYQPYIQVKLRSEDAHYFKIGTEENFAQQEWKSYTPSAFSIHIGEGGYGEKTVIVQFQDAVGNNTKRFTEKITYAQVANLYEVHLDQRNYFCTNPQREVTVDLKTQNAHEMMVANTPDFRGAVWQPFQASFPWTLSEGDGLKTVYAKVRSISHDQSEVLQSTIVLDATAPTSPQIRLKPLTFGERLSGERDIIIQLSSIDADLMQISEDSNFSGKNWRSFSSFPFYYAFKNKTEGKRTLFFRFKDTAGNISKTSQGTITLDFTPPLDPYIGIVEKKDELLPVLSNMPKSGNIRTVTVNAHAAGAKEMKIAEDLRWRNTQWQPYAQSVELTLSEGSSEKRVLAQFRDSLGNVSRLIQDHILIDQQPPMLTTLEIHDPNITTKGKIVKLKPKAQGAHLLLVGETEDFANARVFKYPIGPIDWEFVGEEGRKILYYKFMDYSGNASPTQELSVLLDTEAPKNGRIQINQGEALTNERLLSLQLNIEEGSEMIISDRPNFPLPARWEPYQAEKSWKLDDFDGPHTLYVKFRDDALNESPVYHSKIILDQTPPLIAGYHIYKERIDEEEFEGRTFVQKRKLEYLNAKEQSREVTVHVNASEDTEFVQISLSENFDGAEWKPYRPLFQWTISGMGNIPVYLRFKDHVGNVSSTYQQKFYIF
ncbi:hypothetical protein [Algivirga pacifica]|uniref:Ig-like domain-containing protein n=1 Tax=Algivirga pacifica TaxID=1162670 RepID=A0ABP9DPN6_9BACT